MRGASWQTIPALAFAIFSGAAFFGCAGSSGEDGSDLEVVVARVGEVPITLGNLEQEVKRYKTLFKVADDQGRDKGKTLRKAVLIRLIDNLVLRIEADKLGIVVSDSDLKKETSALLGKYDTARLELILAENEMSFNQWEQSLARRIKIRKLTVKEIDSTIIVSKKEIKEYFKGHANDFKWPMRVRALQIMVEDEVEAETVRKRLLSNADFATIAREVSQSPDAVSGGDLGYFSRGQMPPEFEESVFSLKAGEMSEVIKSIYGFHIFKVVTKKKPRSMTYGEARERIRTLIFDKKREEVFKNWTKKIKKGVAIKVYSDRLPSALP